MPAIDQLEKPLEDIFASQAPPLSNNAKRALVRYLPWINLILGILTLYAVYILWHWAHLVNNFVDYTNSLSAPYGSPVIANNRLTFGIWFGMIVLAIEAVLYLAAFPATRNRKRTGWELMFYALLLNFVYGVAILFTDYGSLGNLIWSVIGSIAGLYLLFQVRASYTHKTKARSTKASVAKTKAKKA
ncbi:MAG TPA: hypothetical protein VHB72_00925 [Candidatus Saccharimonadales bacterium]|nr:hypothetical protein [Candidatus Saccharimonadales bacterium]